MEVFLSISGYVKLFSYLDLICIIIGERAGEMLYTQQQRVQFLSGFCHRSESEGMAGQP